MANGEPKRPTPVEAEVEGASHLVKVAPSEGVEIERKFFEAIKTFGMPETNMDRYKDQKGEQQRIINLAREFEMNKGWLSKAVRWLGGGTIPQNESTYDYIDDSGEMPTSATAHYRFEYKGEPAMVEVWCSDVQEGTIDELTPVIDITVNGDLVLEIPTGETPPNGMTMEQMLDKAIALRKRGILPDALYAAEEAEGLAGDRAKDPFLPDDLLQE